MFHLTSPLPFLAGEFEDLLSSLEQIERLVKRSSSSIPSSSGAAEGHITPRQHRGDKPSLLSRSPRSALEHVEILSEMKVGGSGQSPSPKNTPSIFILTRLVCL